MPTIISTGYSNNAGTYRPKPDISENIWLIGDPRYRPFLQVMRKLKEKKARATTVRKQVYEHEPRLDTVSITAANAGNATTLTVTMSNPSYFKLGDVVENETTGICAYVYETPTTTVKFRHIDGSTDVGAFTAADVVRKISTLKDEYSDPVAGGVVVPSSVYNYTGIGNRVWTVSGTAQAIDYYGPKELARQMGIVKDEYWKDLEGQLIWGQKAADETNYTSLRFPGGILEFISTNTLSGAGLTKNAFLNFAADVFQTGSDERFMACGQTMMLMLNQWGDDVVRTKRTENVLGIDIRTIECVSGGQIHAFIHPLMNNVGTSKYQNYAIICDLDSMEFNPLRKEKITTVDEDGADGVKKQILGEYTFSLWNEEAFGYISAIS